MVGILAGCLESCKASGVDGGPWTRGLSHGSPGPWLEQEVRKDLESIEIDSGILIGQVR